LQQVAIERHVAFVGHRHGFGRSGVGRRSECQGHQRRGCLVHDTVGRFVPFLCVQLED